MDANSAVSIDRADLHPAIAVLSTSTGLSALAPAQRAGAQRLRAMALRYLLQCRASLVANGV
jgi:hypothetical protein